MAAQDEAQELASGGCMADQERLAAALVAALELAMLAAHRLLAGLDSTAGRHAEAATHLARARALAASCASLDELTLALLPLAEPRPATGGPAAAHPRPSEGSARSSTLDAEPASDRGESCGPRGAAPACPAGLTRRELEVLRLIAAGKSNREIAAALYLSPRTAERHVANIYLKLGAHSKAEAAAYALRHGLA